MPIELPKQEFEILVQDDVRIVLYDKIVDKCYTFDINEQKWSFPKGSRQDVIFKLTGLDFNF